MRKLFRVKQLVSLLLVFMLLSTLFAGVAGSQGDPPAKPTNLRVTVVSGTQVNLAWDHSAGNEVYFRIEREQGGATTVINLGAGGTTFSDTSLTLNTIYTYRVQAYNSTGSSEYSDPVIVTTIAVPEAPTNLEVTVVTDTRTNLTWAHQASNEDGFRIERKTDADNYSQIGTVGANATSFLDTSLSAGNTYTYRVRAYNNAGNSAYSNEVTISTGRPAAPTNLVAVTASTSRINLTWTDQANNETGFRIERKTGNSSYAPLINVGPNITVYADTGLTNNTKYTYRVRAYNNAGNSAYSNELTISTGRPAAPTNLVATTASTSRINLTWTDQANNEIGFRIERKRGSGSYVLLASVGANSTAYADTGLTNNTQYTYRVRAYNAAGDSTYSNEATTSTGVLPNAPTNLVAKTVSTSRIDLTWTDNPNNETGFKIERKTGNGSYSQFISVGPNITSYADTGLTNNTQYTYRVRAYNAAGDSAYSHEASATTGNLPALPTNLKAEALSHDRIRLTWEDKSSIESGFRIERKQGTGSYIQIAAVTANTITYTDTGLQTNTEYTYRVRAYNAVGNSAYSNEAKAITEGLPAAPTNLTAQPLAGERILLSWTDRSHNESGFRIERKRGTGSYIQIAAVTANTTSYTDTGLLPETYYAYRVRAYNDYGNSAYSNAAAATTPQQIKTEIKLRVGNPSYQVDGQTLVMDTSPIIRENRTLLPIRHVAEALGASVDWDEKERKATIILDHKQIEVWVDSNTARVNGIHRLIDPDNSRVIPIIVPPGRTMMPLRFIAESLGCKVDWNENTQEINITYPAP